MAKRRAGRKPVRNTEGRRRLREVVDGSSQAAVAAATGAKQQYVSSWVRGASRPEPHFRAALERHYGIPVAAWYSDEEAVIATGEHRASA